MYTFHDADVKSIMRPQAVKTYNRICIHDKFDKGARTYVRTDTFRANIPKLRCRSPTLVLYFLCTCTKRIKTILPFGPFGPKWQDTGKNGQ